MKYKTAGALHIHSTYSDGSKNIEHIIKVAQKANLKWIIITDHNTLKAKEHEGFYQNLCVIAGTEITPRSGNHLLAFNVNEVIDEEIGASNYIDEVHKQGGICFPAHPDENIHRENRHKPLRWDDWSINTFDGLEIWNYLTDWTDNFSIKKSRILQYLFRHKIVKGPTKNLLAWWDRLNNAKAEIIPGIGGLDAHRFSFFRHVCNVRLSDYADYLGSINNILLLDMPLSQNFEEAKKQIITAIHHGNNIITNKKISKNHNIQFYIETKGDKSFTGDTAIIDKYSKLIVKIPQKANIRLIHNGILIYENTTKILEYDKLEPGKYRIEVYKNGIPWIFSNPIIAKQNENPN